MPWNALWIFFYKGFISLWFGFSLGNFYNFYTILLIPELTFFFTSGNILYSRNIPQKYYIWDLLQNNSLGRHGNTYKRNWPQSDNKLGDGQTRIHYTNFSTFVYAFIISIIWKHNFFRSLWPSSGGSAGCGRGGEYQWSGLFAAV